MMLDSENSSKVSYSRMYGLRAENDNNNKYHDNDDDYDNDEFDADGIDKDVKLLELADLETYGFVELKDDTAQMEAHLKELQLVTASIEELSDMMRDFNDIVVLQGGEIDRIEDNVFTCDEVIKGGQQELEKAEEYQATYRNKMIGFSIGAILGGAVFGGGAAVLGTTKAVLSGGVGSSAGALVGYFSS